MPLETEEILQENNKRREGLSQAEDLALKSAAAYFGDEMVRWLGIHEKVLRAVPTELVELEARHMYEDFLYEMENGVYYHFEFESDSISESDLRRFREYEASTVRIYGAPVVAFAVKFLDKQELGLNKEEMAMTILGQMIWDDAMEKGIEKGRKEESERYGRLILKLSEENKTDLLVKTASDPVYREALYKKYGF